MKLGKNALQEGELHFQAVLELVGPVRHFHLGQLQGFVPCVHVDRDVAQWRAKGARLWQRQPQERHAVCRAEEYDAPDARGEWGELVVAAGGDDSGIIRTRPVGRRSGLWAAPAAKGGAARAKLAARWACRLRAEAG